MLEKRFYAVPPQLFTADGTINGVITIAGEACQLFKVKMQVLIKATSLPTLLLEIKEIDNEGNVQVGPIAGTLRTPGANTGITARTDISAYTVVLGANISADQQRRPDIDWSEAMRAMYDEEPSVAMRSVLVDECGDRFSTTNPLPTTVTNSPVPQAYDDIVMTYDSVTQDMTTATYKDGGVTVATLTMTYDVNGNLTEVART